MCSIELIGLPKGNKVCNTIMEAEIVLSECVEPVKIKVKSANENLTFIYDPLVSGFHDALIAVQNKISSKADGLPPGDIFKGVKH